MAVNFGQLWLNEQYPVRNASTLSNVEWLYLVELHLSYFSPNKSHLFYSKQFEAAAPTETKHNNEPNARNDTLRRQGIILITENRRQFPKAAAIPTRSVLISKCVNYTRDDICDSFPEHGYPISFPENEILTLS